MRKRGEKYWLVVLPIHALLVHALLGWFSYVPWPEVKSTTLIQLDWCSNELNYLARPGKVFINAIAQLKNKQTKNTYIPSSLTTPTHSLELSLLETQPILANVIRCPVSFVYLWLSEGGQYHYQHYQEEQCKGASGQRKCCPLCFWAGRGKKGMSKLMN